MRVLKQVIPAYKSTHALYLPDDARIVHIDMDSNSNMIGIWYETADYARPNELREIYTFGTGDIIPDDYVHLATVYDRYQHLNNLIWHVYKKGLPK